MGLLDQVIGDFMAGGAGNGSPIGGLLSSLLGGGGQPGGIGNLGGLISMFEQAGLGHIAQSWVGNGANEPVSPQQLRSVFGEDRVQSMASQTAMSPQDLLSMLAQHLPATVDAMTLRGKVPTEGTISV